MGRAKGIFSAIAWTILNNVISILYGIVSVPFLINYFGKEEYGLIGIALSVNVYIHLLDMGMTNTNIRYFTEYLAKGEQNKVQRLFETTNLFYLIIGPINSLILFGLSFFTHDMFEVTLEQAVVLRNLLIVLGVNATFSWMSVSFDQFLTANKLIGWIKQRSVFLKVMQFVALALTIFCKFSIEVYFVAYIFMATFILPWTIVKTKKIAPNIMIKYRFDKEILMDTFPYAMSIFSFSIFQFLAFNFRPLFLGSMTGPSAVADFTIMNTIATVVTVLSGSFMQVLLPIVTDMTVKKEEKQIETIVNDGTKYVTILLTFVIMTLIVSMPELLTLYVGEEYASLTIWMDIWLLTLLLSHRNVMASLVFTERNVKSVAYMGAVAMIIAVLCYWLFIPMYGVGGVVIGFLCHELTHTLFYYCYFLPKKLKINTGKVFLKSVLPVWICFGIVCLVIYRTLSFEETTILYTVVLKTLIIGIIYIIAIRYVLLSSHQIKQITSLVRKN